MLGIENTATNTSRIIANTSYGPRTEADRDVVVKVRAAGLWEYPLEMSNERGTTKEMKEAGEHPVVGHAGLDATCRKIFPELNITLLHQASPQQEQTDWSTSIRSTPSRPPRLGCPRSSSLRRCPSRTLGSCFSPRAWIWM